MHYTTHTTESGGLYSFGNGALGRLGGGTDANAASPTVVPVLKGTKIVKIAAGGAFSGMCV